MEGNLCHIYSHISDKGVTATVYGDFKKLNSQKINDWMEKWGKELKSFFKGRSPNGLKEYEENLNISGHKGSTNQKHTEIPSQSIRMAISKIQKTTNVGKDVGKKEYS
jgi:hypothetical protein